MTRRESLFALVHVILMGCASAPKASSVAASSPDGALLQPYVLVVTGAATCENGRANIGGVLTADANYAAKYLAIEVHGPGLKSLGKSGMVLRNPSFDELKGTLHSLAERGSLAAGLVLVYSGHGFREGAGKKVRSMLCLRGGEHPARALIDAVSDVPLPKLPWYAMVLNACESAYVDLASLSRPTAVLAASPHVMSVHAFPDPKRPAGSCRADLSGRPVEVQATPLVRATTDALARPWEPQHDRNEDGIVTAHELFHVLIDAAAEGWPRCSDDQPKPRFQLQARSEIPVRFHIRAHDTRQNIEGIVEKLERGPESDARRALVRALRAQLDLATRRILPEAHWDFLITDSKEVAMRVSSIDVASVGNRECWGHPLHLALAPSDLNRKEQQAIGRFSMFSAFYELKQQGRSVDVIYLYEKEIGDQSPLRASSMTHAISEIPSRIDRVDNDYFRAVTAIPEPAECQGTILHPILQKRVFQVCTEEEGQCFH
jgi:hypothetical protein